MTTSDRTDHLPSKRHALALGLAASLLPAFPNQILAATALDLGDAEPIRRQAVQFLATLDDAQRKRARFPVGGDVWRRWNYFGVGGYIKPGLRLEEMSASQKDAAWSLASSILSPTGLEKARNVMLNQEILREQGNGVNERSGERFSFAVFGELSVTGEWALRIEGHHLSLSYTIRNNRLVGVTPSSFSSSPNRVLKGRHVGLITLKQEDALARKLAGDLTGAIRSRVFVEGRPYGNILASAGRETTLGKRQGIPVGDLSKGQNEMAQEVLSAFMVDHLNAPYGAAIAKVLNASRDAASYSVMGSPNAGEPIYYRFHGDRFVVEFASVDSEALHLHTIVHVT
jgi:Protein of unknown function (DUF3500)